MYNGIMQKLIAIFLLVPIIIARCTAEACVAVCKAAKAEWKAFVRIVTDNPYRI